DTAAVIVAVVAAVLGAVLAWSFARARYAPAVATVTAERDVLRGQVAALDERVQRLRSAEQEAADATLALAPVTEALRRVERQVGVL
ncbi:hypothetical protein ACP3WZ_25105, partial [Salmonella enterica]|uniref:hypothetical protein n=1 Tax=Salmonella enterica TaxID=28901 RepID=UPI003CF13852